MSLVKSMKRDTVQAVINAAVPLLLKGKVEKKAKPKNKASKSKSLEYRQQPVSFASASRAVVPKLSQIISIPFEGMDILLTVSTAATNNPLVASDGTGSTKTGGFALHPNAAEPNTDSLASFGYSIANLSLCFTQWRCTKLKVDYVPILATSYSGVVAIGAKPDPEISAPTSIQAVASCNPNMIVAVSRPESMDLSSLCGQYSSNNWYYTDSFADSTTQDRFVNQGSLVCYAAGLTNAAGAALSAGTAVGFLRFSGVIQFTGMARSDLLALSKQQVRLKHNITLGKDCLGISSSSSSSSGSSSSENSSTSSSSSSSSASTFNSKPNTSSTVSHLRGTMEPQGSHPAVSDELEYELVQLKKRLTEIESL